MSDAQNDSPVFEVLNRALAADPAAISCLLLNRVPCNNSLADDPHVIVSGLYPGNAGPAVVSAMGLLNGILTALGHPVVAMKFEQVDNHQRICGFCVYKEPAEPATAEVPVNDNPDQSDA